MTFPAVIDLSALDGSDGFRLDGIDMGDASGISVSSAGDVNGDGFADIIIGASDANSDAGESYVIFGKATSFGASFDLATLDGSDGFRLDGIDAGDFSGRSVSSAGDVNGDGFADIIIGAPFADPGGDSYAGESYVVFGKASGFGPNLNLGALDGSDGFRLDGIDANDRIGRSVSSAGDVNGDGFADIIIGASEANSDAGESYVIFGKATSFGASFDLATLDGSDGFRLDGIDAGDYSGLSVSSAGDVNGDGFADIIIGAPFADPGGDSLAGESYVVFGKASGFGPNLNLGALDGSDGFRLDGIDAGDASGRSVSSAGDVNGDGFADIIIGASRGDPGGDSESGESYVIFGKASGFGASLDLASFDGSDGFRINGIDAFDRSGRSVSSAGDINGDGFDDIIIGADGADSGAGESYVVFGKISGFGSSLDLATLDGSDGFRLDGIDAFDLSGDSVSSAGDVNGDGFADIIIGALDANSDAGESYVVFGRAPTTSVIRIGSDADQAISGGDFSDTLSGEAGDDSLNGGVGADSLDGGAGNDTVDSGSGFFDDTLLGGAGDDVLILQTGGSGDSVDGGAGIDTLDESSLVALGSTIFWNIGAGFSTTGLGGPYNLGVISGVENLVTTTDSFDNVLGTADANDIRTLELADTIDGAGGDDTIEGGEGNDTIEGGAGKDTARYLGNSSDFTIVDNGDGSGTVTDNNATDGDEGTDTLSGMECLVFADTTIALQQAPVAVDDAPTTDEDVAITIDVLANDTDVNPGDVLTVTAVSTPSNGAAVISGSGTTVTYTPSANFNGADSFTYTISDGNGGADTGTVNVTVTSIDDAPVIGALGGDTVAEFAADGTVVGTVTVIDIDSTPVFSLTNNAGGRFGINPSTGAITVVDGLALDFEQANAFTVTVQVSDGTSTDSSSFIINVSDVNSPEIVPGDGGDRRHVGDDGADTLRGGAGDDTLAGGGGGDSLNGSSGIDTVDYTTSSDAVLVNLDSQTANGGDATGDSLNGFENALGGAGADTLIGSDGNNFLDGGNRDDLLMGGLGDDTLVGSAGDDTLDGGVGNDRIQGDVRSDSILGGGGSDTLQGNNGDDIIDGGSGGDRILGGPADDLIAGGSGNDTLFGNNNEDTIDGGAGGDLVFGGALNDSILGDSGGDDLKGNAGDDTIRGGTGGDSISGQANDDLLYGDANNDTVSGNGGNDSVFGGDGADLLRGNAGDDIVYGEAGADQLLGGNGDDVIVGGAGEDRLAGNNGSDVFIFTEGDSGASLASADLITDFSQAENDVIRLVGIDAIAGGGDDAFDFIGTAAFSGTAGELRYEQTGGDTHIFADTNGDGSADFALQLLGTVDLVAGDFVL